jgi:hypothetical protein
MKEIPSVEKQIKEEQKKARNEKIKAKIKEKAEQAWEFTKKEAKIAEEKSREWLENKKLQQEEKKKLAREEKISKIETELEQEDGEIDEDDKESIESLDPRELTDKQLKILAIRGGDGFWGSNEYEDEILRRIKTEAKIETDKRILINEQKRIAKEKIAEAGNTQKSEGFIEWISKP